MKKYLLNSYLLAAATAMLLLASCRKDDHPDQSENPSGYSSEVLDKWMSLQLRLMRNATGIPNQAFSRHFAYSGAAALESMAPGLPMHWKWSSKWNGLTGLPAAGNKKNYYYPANVNAAMAAINRSFFPNASPADKASIDSLENALTQEFMATQSQAKLNLSAQFGKAVAAAIFAWSETDGYKNASNPYTAPSGPGLWKPTPPANAAPLTPYWGANRPMITGSTDNTQPAPPTPYSIQPSSPFYLMVKQVYDVSATLTEDQKAMAIFWRDVPGVSSPGHWLSILQQLVRKSCASLDKAALAYALTGTALNDALISCFKAKYHYNLVRPVTYIREVIGQEGWNSFIGTPAHPEYPSAHSSLSAAAAAVLDKLFSKAGPFTDHTYDYLGYQPRSYQSLIAIGNEAGQSRLYAGIHYQPSIDAGLWQGRKVADNIFQKQQH
ncbi:MAG TPA: vanadium-dependent haloperoxidase [Flavisolibacter sp.]|nr:vanadium-dependent haloperoxidase [Flavisolibacter sp.]